MKKIICELLACILLVGTFSGCRRNSAKTDLTRQKIVVAIGIDTEENGIFDLCVRVFDASDSSSSQGDSDSSGNTIVYDIQGETIAKAISNLTLQTGDEPVYSQNHIIVIGEGAAQSGLEKITDFFVRDQKTRLNATLAVARGTAREIVKSELGVSMPQTELEEIIASGKITGEVKTMNILDVAKRTAEATSQITLPIIELIGEGDEQRAQAVGMGVFKDGKLVGYLDIDQTRGVMFFLDQYTQGSVAVAFGDDMATVHIEKTKTRVTPVLVNGAVEYRVKVKTDCEINEIDRNISTSLSDEEGRAITQNVEEKIEQCIMSAFECSAKLYCSDILRLGKALKLAHPKYYRQNENNFDFVMQNSTLAVDVKVKLSRVGARA